MPKYKIDLDIFCEEIFHEMNDISEGSGAHECIVEHGDKDAAAEQVCVFLHSFIMNQMEEVED